MERKKLFLELKDSIETQLIETLIALDVFIPMFQQRDSEVEILFRFEAQRFLTPRFSLKLPEMSTVMKYFNDNYFNANRKRPHVTSHFLLRFLIHPPPHPSLDLPQICNS